MTTNNDESGYLVSTDSVTGQVYYNYVTQFTNGKPMQITTPDGYITSGDIDVTTQITGVVSVANGGTSQSTYTTGDILYASAANTLSKLAIGSATQVLTVTGGVPVWAAAGGGGSGVTTVGANVAATANSASITGTTINMAAAGATSRGVVYGETNNNTNTMYGYGNTSFNASGSFNTVVGEGSTGNISDNDRNTLVGYACGPAMTDISFSNTMVGAFAGNSMTDGQSNVFIGNNSGINVTAGNFNVCIGSDSGSTIDMGNSNISIGFATIPTTGANNEYIFGSAIFGSGTNSYTFDINAIPAVLNSVLQVDTSAGQITRATSSMRYKNIISYPGNFDMNSEQLLKLKPFIYDFKADKRKTPHIGYILEDVDNIDGCVSLFNDSPLKNIVRYADIKDDNGVKNYIPDSLDYSNLVVPIIDLLQKQNVLLNTAQNKINALNNQLNTMMSIMHIDTANDYVANIINEIPESNGSTIAVDWINNTFRKAMLRDTKGDTDIIGYYCDGKLHTSGVCLIHNDNYCPGKWVKLAYKSPKKDHTFYLIR